MRRHLAVALLLGLAASPLASQTILETPTSTIEFVGLKRWTLKMIEDSLAVYAPKDSLTAHACAAILRDKLHFADAAVSTYVGFDKNNPKKFVAITLVEPQDSALIHYKPAFRDSAATRADWTSAYAAFRANNELAQVAIQTPAFYKAHLSPEDRVKFTKVDALHSLLVARRDPRDLEQAIHTLETDRNSQNRTMALIVIASFADRDSAWHALADGLRDPSSGMVNATAAQLLGMLTRSAARPVDWRPMADRLRYIIDGTNLFGLDQLMTTLGATAINSSLAPILLQGGGTIVEAKLHSGDAHAKAAAISFLSQISGTPHSTDPAVLEQWMRNLRRTAMR
ncbi:MAG TPA: hypothetical protein VK636_01560 [Gemmatimonadaceae bacterium]|nr:hypothetical protein [Gemmatimonadaceae bacterium]